MSSPNIDELEFNVNKENVKESILSDRGISSSHSSIKNGKSGPWVKYSLLTVLCFTIGNCAIS